MSRPVKIDKDNDIARRILVDHMSGLTIQKLAKKYKFGWATIARFLGEQELKQTILWRQVLDNKAIDVFADIGRINSYIKKLYNDYEESKVDVEKLGLDLVSKLKVRAGFSKELKDTIKIHLKLLKTYSDTVNKWIEKRQSEDLKKAFIEVIKGADPEIAVKVLAKLAEYKE